MNALQSIGEPLEALGLPKPDQIGFVVRDLDESIARYEPLFGPFRVTTFDAYQVSYRGAAPTSFDVKFAFGQIGDLEIELIQWVSGDTPHRDFIQSGREGMHHLRFRIDHIDPWIEKLNGLGYETIWYNRATPEIAFAYCERAGDPLIVELLEFPLDAVPGGDPSVPDRDG